MFNYKRYLRSVPAPTIQAYFDARAFPVPADFDWTLPENVFAKALGRLIDQWEDELRGRLIADLREAADLASESGFRAIVNACPLGHPLISEVKAMATDQERALWVYWRYDDDCRRARWPAHPAGWSCPAGGAEGLGSHRSTVPAGQGR